VLQTFVHHNVFDRAAVVHGADDELDLEQLCKGSRFRIRGLKWRVFSEEANCSRKIRANFIVGRR
jgi:hypothetical protein